MTRSSYRLRPVVVLTLLTLLFSAVAVPTSAAPPPELKAIGRRRSNRDVRVGRHAARPDGEVRQGRRHADLQGTDGGRRDRRQRDAPGLPAEHRRRLVHDGHRHLSVRARLDEQHVLPRRDAFSNRTSFSAPACCRPTRSPTQPSARARRSPRSTGSAAPPRTSTARPSTSRISSRTAACSSAQTNATEQAGSAFFGVTYQVGLRTRRLAGVPAGDPAAPPKQTTWRSPRSRTTAWTPTDLQRPTPPNCTNPNRTYNVYFYDSVDRRRRRATTTRSSARSARRARRRRSTSRSATSCRSS